MTPARLPESPITPAVCQRCGACCSAVIDGELVACRHLDVFEPTTLCPPGRVAVARKVLNWKGLGLSDSVPEVTKPTQSDQLLTTG